MRTTGKQLLIALTLNAVAVLALAYSLGWIDMLKSWSSSNTTQTDTDDGSVGTGMASLNADDIFPVDPLPWSFDFDNLPDPPDTWIGIDEGYDVSPDGGGRVFIRRPPETSNPEFTPCLFGGFGMSNYSIQSDVQAKFSDGELPNVGIIAQGYVLELQGANQKLEIRGWAPHPDVCDTIDFPWSPDSWYVMKLRVSVADGKVTVQGRVWPRGEEEPEKWDIDTSVEEPNRTGCPGVFGDNPNTEVLFDNIQVTAN